MQKDLTSRGFLGQGLLALFLSVVILGLAFFLATGTSGIEESMKPEEKDPNEDPGTPTHSTAEPSDKQKGYPRFSEEMDKLLEPPAFPATNSGGKATRTFRVPFKPPERTPKYKPDSSDP